MITHLLYEGPSGYALFERLECDEIGREIQQVQESLIDYKKFKKALKLHSFCPFTDLNEAVNSAMEIADGQLTLTLKNFLDLSFKKKKKICLGVQEKTLASNIMSQLKIDCVYSELVHELSRIVRLHGAKVLKPMKEGDLERAQLGLGHAYSRSKLKFNVNRNDNMVIQSIKVLDQLDKDINTFSMRIREWYSWHFPELIKLVPDCGMYAALIKVIRNKQNATKDLFVEINNVLENEELTNLVIEAASMSMGTDISETDMINIEQFAEKVVNMTNYRKTLHKYLTQKMSDVAPNLSALIGETVGARLISHAGSLTSLSKYPASTVQVLGAEKALFRALKTKSNTPKYGLIYHSAFIGKAGLRNKGKISRYLANKCSIASRIDSFSDELTNSNYGLAMRAQVEERLEYLESGKQPKKNIEVMEAVAQFLK